LRASSAAFSNVRRSVLGSDQVVKNNLSFSDREKSLIFFDFFLKGAVEQLASICQLVSKE
jgi:hypothetical protein